jgi:DNA-binding beta-propeller fold protein YncE
MRAHRIVLTQLLLAGALLTGCVATGSASDGPVQEHAGPPPAGGSAADAPGPGSGGAGTETEAPDRPGGASDSGRCEGGTAGSDVVATIPLSHRPVDVALDAGNSTLYASSERGDVVSMVDTGSRAVTGTIQLRDRPYGLYLDADRGALYATLPGIQVPGASIAVVDTARGSVVRSIRFDDGIWPTDAVVDPATGLLFVVNSGDDSVVAFNSVTGARIRSIRVDIDPIHIDVVTEAGLVLVSGGKGLAAIDIRTLSLRDVIQMPGGAFAIDREVGGVFVANQGFGTLSVVDLAAFEVVGRVAVGGRGPFDVAFDTASGLAYVTGTADGELVLVDVATLRIVERISGANGVRSWYGAIAVDHTRNCVYVADLESSAIVVLDRRR